MIKTLLVTLDFPPKKGGVSHQLFNQINQFPAESISVLTNDAKHDDLKFAYNVYRKKLLFKCPIIWPKWLRMFYEIHHLIKKEGTKIILAGQILPIGTAALVYQKFFNIPYAVFVYGLDLLTSRHSPRKMKLIKSILKNAQFVIANSNFTRKLAIANGADVNKMIVSYPCPHYRQTDLKSDGELTDFKQKNHLNDKRILLTVGNLVYRKGHDIIIKSLIKLIIKFSNIQYIIVGDGPEKSRLEELVSSLNLQQHVIFAGRVADEQLAHYYQCADVLVMPSREIKDNKGASLDIEGFGMVFLEANTFGKPVIGGVNGGQPEAIQNNITGFTVDPDDTENLIEKISVLLSDKKLAEKLGNQGRIRVANYFQWENQVAVIKNRLQ